MRVLIDRPPVRDGPDRRDLAARMQRDGAAFPRTGDPTAGTDGEAWPLTDPQRHPARLFDREIRPAEDPDGEERRLREEVLGQ
ncbi:MAG: hypothetical protein K6V97_03170 [Actinomycetia bacterium]|nr:hypothetical protein [Actinomycetes bacterium]